jgi:hypothetical protein
MSLQLEDRSASPSSAVEPKSDGGHGGGHKAVLVFMALLAAYACLPVFGVGFYRNSSGDRFFQLWYLIGFMVIAFFLMHEVITPIPPKGQK